MQKANLLRYLNDFRSVEFYACSTKTSFDIGLSADYSKQHGSECCLTYEMLFRS